MGPVTAYGKTKLAAEEEARRAARQGVDVVIARAFQHTGPRQNLPMMLPEWARQVAAGGDAPIEVQTLQCIDRPERRRATWSGRTASCWSSGMPAKHTTSARAPLG